VTRRPVAEVTYADRWANPWPFEAPRSPPRFSG
jgi:hypothetical protein